MTFRNVHVSQFRIEAASTRFYANGKQQCHVRVSILKQGMDSTTGMLVRIPLTAQERDSVSTALLSPSLDYNALSMPLQWSVNSRPNGYDLGLINQSSLKSTTKWSCHPVNQNEEEFKNKSCFPVAEDQEVQAIIADSQVEIDPKQQNDVPEIINVYVSAAATGTQTIMAKAMIEVSVGDQLRTITVTTNMNSGNNTFNSMINLDAIVPFAIQPAMLSASSQTIQDREENVSKWDIHHQQITLFRWTLPFNLRIREYLSGNENSIFYRQGNTHENNRFLTSGRFYGSGRHNVNARDNMQGGCIWDYPYQVNVGNNEMLVSLLHVRGCSWTSGIRTGTHTVSFIDNFGNTQGFIFSPEDTGRKISINRYN